MEFSALIEYLFEFITESRKNRMLEVLNNRTRYISILLEDIYQPHNASAVLRSCDCFGIQDVLVVERINKFSPDHGVSLAADKWLSVNTWNGDQVPIAEIIRQMKQSGYRIVATTPHTNDVQLHEFDIGKGPVLLMFGSELKGLSQQALDNADEYLKIPIWGFSESLNISVSAAVILHHLTLKMRQSNISWGLSDSEKLEILQQWLIRDINNAGKIIERWREQNCR